MGQRSGAPKKTYIPEDVVFQTKPQIALDRIDRAKANGIEVIAWTADELYGRDDAFLDGLDVRGEAYVMEVPPNAHVWLMKPKVLKTPVVVDSMSYPPQTRKRLYREEVQRQNYHARRNAQASQSHRKTRRQRLAALGINPDKIKSVPPNHKQ